MYYSIESYLYLFERTMNPTDDYIDNSYRQEVLDDALEVAKMFTVKNKCYYVHLEKHLGNPEIDNSSNHSNCGFCPFCRNEKSFPAICREGTERVVFDVFHPQALNGLASEQKPLTLKVIVDAIREYRNSRLLMTKSKAKDRIAPDTVKTILFLLLAAEILTLEYHTEEKKAVFTLARTSLDASSFAINNDDFWKHIDLK